MKVFLSWSGDRSRRVAQAVRDWLPYVVSEIEPFMSSEIDAGAHWQTEIAAQLESTSFGIIFTTRENQHKPWINFEAGALIKSIAASRIVPLAVDLKPSDIQNPLGQFQAQRLDLDGIRKVLASLNKARATPAPKELLDKVVAKWWPDLESTVARALQFDDRSTLSAHPARSERDILEEVLTAVRALTRDRSAGGFINPSRLSRNELLFAGVYSIATNDLHSMKYVDENVVSVQLGLSDASRRAEIINKLTSLETALGARIIIEKIEEIPRSGVYKLQ